MIKAEHLSKTYLIKEKKHIFGKKEERKVPAVRDVSLEIPKGKHHGDSGN